MLTVHVEIENWDKSSYIVCICGEADVADVDCTVEEVNVGTA
jgi:hypothetical protein